MAILTRKLDNELQDLFQARHGLRRDLAEFIRISVQNIRRQSEDLSRAEIAQYISTLNKLISTEVNCG